MILPGRVAVGWLFWLAGAAAALAQQAPVDTIPSSTPLESQAVLMDTLVAGGAVMTVPEPGFGVRVPAVPGMDGRTDRRLIMELASTSLGDALFVIPGVHVVNLGWHGLPQVLNLRGTGPEDIVCLLDGIPLSDNRLETLDLNWVPLAGVETCQIAKGGLSSIYGSGSNSGVLGLRSEQAMPEFPESEIGAWWGSFDSRSVSLLFNRRITERLGVMGTYEDFSTGGWIDDSSADNNRFFGKATALVGDATRFDLVGYTYKGDFERPDSCPGRLTTHPARRKNERNLLGASMVTGQERRFEIRYYRIGMSESYYSEGTRSVEDGLLHGSEMGVSWLAPDSAETHVGVGFKSRRLDSDSLGNRRSTDYYLQGLKEARLRRWTLLGSVRLAKTSGFGMQVGGGLEARVTVGDGVSFYSRLDRGYGFPGFHALYHRGEDQPADSRIGTETSWGLEAGSVVSGGPITALLRLFARNASGLALWLTDDSCRTYMDTGLDLTLTGLEMSLVFCSRPWLETEVSYSTTRARDGTGARPAYVPPYTASALARVRRSLSRHISAGMTFAGRYSPPTELGSRLVPCTIDAPCLSDAELPANLSATLTAYIDIDRVTVYFRVENLMNDDIKTAWGRPGLPSRSYEFGTSWRLLD